MSNKLYFALGALVGAAGGSVAAYFLTRRHYEAEMDEVIDDYAERCKERIDDIVSYYEGGKDAEESLEEPEPKPEEFASNEGVKKYHHYNGGQFDESSVQSVFSQKNLDKVEGGGYRFKKEEDVTEGQKAIKEKPEFTPDINGIEELDADELQNAVDLIKAGESTFSTEELVYDINKDELMLNYDTEDAILAEEYYGMTRTELIGDIWKWATDYVNEDTQEGDFYVRNENLGVIFLVNVIFDPSQPIVEVSE